MSFKVRLEVSGFVLGQYEWMNVMDVTLPLLVSLRKSGRFTDDRAKRLMENEYFKCFNFPSCCKTCNEILYSQISFINLHV